MRLYSHQLSPYARVVNIVMNLLNYDNECLTQYLDLFNGEQKEAWFRMINPKHQVPTLVLDDGFTLTESNAIAKYLVRRYGGHFIYPSE